MNNSYNYKQENQILHVHVRLYTAYYFLLQLKKRL